MSSAEPEVPLSLTQGPGLPLQSPGAPTDTPLDDSPQSPASPGSETDGRTLKQEDRDQRIAVDYMKNRYEGGGGPGGGAKKAAYSREPRKLDMNWDKVAEERGKKEDTAAVLRGFDLLHCLNVQVSESKAQFEGLQTNGTNSDTRSSGSNSPLPVNRQPVEKVAAPEITKNVRAMFESGQIPDRHQIVKTSPKLDIPTSERSVYENEPSPVAIEGLVRSADVVEKDAVEKGYTKNLLSQWQTKGSQEYKSERKPIKIAEDDGRVLENEPIKRSDVVNAEYKEEAGVVEKGYTKNLLNQWKTKGTEEFKSERKPIQLAEDEGRVLENEPMKRTDVVNAEVERPEPTVQKGYTKNLLTQWSTKGSEEFKSNRKPINIIEDEGKVLENEPVKRTDVVNSEQNGEEALYQKGYAKNMLSQWTAKGSEEFKAERAPIKISEDEGRILENEPVKRTDVVNAEQNGEEALYQKGYAKNMLNQWTIKGSEEFKAEKKPINLAEGEGKVAENEPTKRTDVVNAEASQEEISVQKGTTKNLLSQWVSKGSEQFKSERKAIVLAEDEGRILENEPVKRSDVAREEDNSEELWLHKGYTKNLAGFWVAPKDEPRVERGPINIHEGVDTSAPAVYENTPQQLEGVVRSSANEDEVLAIERGRAKNIATMWQSRRDDPVTSNFKLDIDPNAGVVLENEPETREDVFREQGSAEETISVREARNMRNVWKKKETGEDEIKTVGTPQQVRFTPPRELSPVRNDFKSVETLTLSSPGSQQSPAGEAYYNGAQ